MYCGRNLGRASLGLDHCVDSVIVRNFTSCLKPGGVACKFKSKFFLRSEIVI